MTTSRPSPSGGSPDPAALREAVGRAYSGSAFLRAKLDAAGVEPSSIRHAGDLARLPFTVKGEIREAHFLDYAAVPAERIVRIHSSSGTTGRRTICAYTARDIDDWLEMCARSLRYAGVTPHDRVQPMVGYGLWTAGIGFQEAAERLGAMVVPTGPGNTELQLEMMREAGTTVLCATASFTLLIAELVERRGIRGELSLRVGISGSERWGDGTRARIESLLGVPAYDLYGLTELWGPGAGVECHRKDGIHVWADHYHVEIVDPVTLSPVPPGTVGEIVVTTFAKEATPLLRYRTRDLSYLYGEPCPCGSPHPRIGRIVGRSDDQIKVRGVIFLPAQVDTVLAGTPGAGPEFQAHVTRDGAGRDGLTVRVEADDRPGLAGELAERLRAETGIRVDVDLVPMGALPRSERKTRRVFDHRDL
ncbi:phenylacetate--CoA ligase [Actinomadura sp. 7K507]|uniref:phenylacetate--CoA ligase family protein n=1 Tax=Actinomadura sp. 7K507 TaxID=2530365 RepID=UPI001042BB5E|nr:phenylacetate--CoA ligase [Actinomadura sp. 7K507]TDC88733.1 phenylacetate--CoA ligase family protein [Actinomadura sp. 7K507]